MTFQVSHQDDTGYNSFHEWAHSGDIALRAIEQIHFATTVLAWDLRGPLYGTNRYEPTPTNTPAFDAELAFSNEHHPDIFLALHNDGGAPSGVFAIVNIGDTASSALADRILATLAATTGLPNRGVREARYYSLEPVRNDAKYRILLELGDNVQDRAFLGKASGRQAMADAIVTALREFVPRHYPSASADTALRFIDPDALAGTDPRIVLAQQHLGPMPASPWQGFRG